MKRVIIALIVIFAIITACGKTPTKADAELINAQGDEIGVASILERPEGIVVRLEVHDLPEGLHAFHIHETGKCEGDFKSAGGHFNPFNTKHGLKNAEGPHSGDMQNIYVGPDGTALVEVNAPLVTLAPRVNSLIKADGTAFVIHEGPDDYVSDPSGAAGARIACGVISK